MPSSLLSSATEGLFPVTIRRLCRCLLIECADVEAPVQRSSPSYSSPLSSAFQRCHLQISITENGGTRNVVVGGKKDVKQHFCGVIGGQSTNFRQMDTEVKVNYFTSQNLISVVN